MLGNYFTYTHSEHKDILVYYLCIHSCLCSRFSQVRDSIFANFVRAKPLASRAVASPFEASPILLKLYSIEGGYPIFE